MGKDQDLLEACRTGNVAAVEKHLQGRLQAKNRSSRASSGGALSTLSKSFWSLKSANINCVDASGDTPLHLAALNGHKDIVSILLECEASPTILDSQDCSPLHLAAWNGHTDICNQLIVASDDQAFVNLQTRDGNTALHFSAQHGHDTTLSLLLQKKADPTIRNLEDLSPLDLAAQYDRLEIVKQLVTSHPELVAQRSALNTPLHLASRNGHRVVVQYLIDAGFPLDAKTDKGTALHEAANFCKLDVIRLLLERGIDITVKSQTGCTAEDILRSIPSKAAEDALNILKTHIYHQRTPDSDGERGIISETQLEPSLPQGTPPSAQTLAAGPAPSPTERISYLYKRRRQIVTCLLPSGHDATPPPIPPRLSVRSHGGPIDSFSEKGLVPLKVPIQPERGSDRDHSSDEDKHKLSPRDVSPGPRDVSPTIRDVSPSSARSPTDQPKKPPRKKPLSFRRVEQGPHLPTEPPSGGANYVNLDPNVERALVDARVSAETDSIGQQKSDTVLTVVTTSNIPDLQNPAKSVTAEENNKLNHKQMHEPTDVTQSTDNSSMTSQVVDHDHQVGDVDQIKDEASMKPPSSLDIGQAEEKLDQAVRSPSHRQLPTPDCPPPSPGTAIQNIHSRIQPMEKRRSRDIETITDSSLTGQDEQSSPSSVVSEDDVLNSDLSRASLTPVKEEQPVTAGGNLVGKGHSKKKPTPLPRKSSLTSDTKDLYPPPLPAAAAAADSVSSKPVLLSHSSLEGEREAQNLPDPGYLPHKQGPHMKNDEMTREGGTVIVHSLVEENVDGHATVEVLGETVLMRRSLAANSEPTDWEGHAFADYEQCLLRGSVIGPARDVVHQLGGATTVTAADLRKKRKSTLSTFAPLMEEEKDIDPDKVMGEIDSMGVGQHPGLKKLEDNVFDDSEDWAQIAEIISSYGGRISSSGDYALFEAQIDHLLSSKGDSKIQSVGDWLADIGLSQYENTLVANGFDDTDFLGGNILEDQDLLAIGVEKPNHRQTIIEAASSLASLKPIDPTNPPVSVAEWLSSLRLDYYYDTFMSHKYDSMDRVVKLWELELVTVLDITSVGHRKRILASLGERPPETASTTRTRVASLEGLSNPKSPFEHVDLYRDYTGVRSRVSDTGGDSDVGHGSFLEYETSDQSSPIQGRRIRDSSLHIRAPHLIHYTGAIRQWRHRPEILIKGCCNYTAHYLGSTLVKELKGAMSTQEGIAKLKKSSEVISKIPTIMLSISFKGVKFIDAASKKVVCDHEIANIFCACQDGEHMNFFAYITKDRETDKHYCHVFSVRSKELAGEIILTLGEAFEIAYQMVLKERAERAAEEFDKLSTSDGDDTTSVSSKTSVHTV